jgi:hypothetical protein
MLVDVPSSHPPAQTMKRIIAKDDSQTAVDEEPPLFQTLGLRR